MKKTNRSRSFAVEAKTVSRDQDFIVERIDRRQFLVRIGSAVATFSVVGTAVGTMVGCENAPTILPGVGERWSSRNPFPNADAPIQPVSGTRAEFTPLEDHYIMYNFPDLPTHSIEEWTLTVDGLVEQPFEWRLDDIKRHEPLHAFITLSCISNPVAGPLISTTRWTGTSLQKLLPLWKLKPEATHLKILGADGFYETVALDTILADERVMLAYEWDGVPLPMEHGFPLRIYIPSRYGMKQPKWIVKIEATDHWEPGFSVAKTWDKDAIVETTSFIDTVVGGGDAGQDDAQSCVYIGGISHAGARGISKVEVRIDDGPWQQAQLRPPLSDLTWVLWRCEWPFQAGEHTFSVRAYDSTGTPQTEEVSPPYPDGATGIHQKKEQV